MSRPPPIPTENKPTKGPTLEGHHPPTSPGEMADHKHHNSDEQGQTANIKQNTTNAGFFKGRRTK